MAQATQETGLSLSTLGLDKTKDATSAAMIQVAIQVAQQYQRDESAILKAALAGLDVQPDLASKSLYSIQYEGKNSAKVEGLSIRAAEALGALWKHLRIAVRIVAEDDNGYDLEALAWDMQNNYWLLLPYRVSKWETPRQGNAFRLGDQRLLQRLQAGISKVRRNVTLAMIPAHIKAAYEKRVRELVARGPLTKRANVDVLQAVLDSFSEYSLNDTPIGQAHLEGYVGKPAAEWTGQDISELRALYNSLQDNEVTVVQAFGQGEEVLERPAAPTVVTPDSILGGKATGRSERPAPAQAPRPRIVKPEPAKVEPPKPAPATVGVTEDEFREALERINLADSEEALNEVMLDVTALIKRAAREQKGPLLDASMKKRASFTE